MSIYSNLKNREAVTVYYIGNFLDTFAIALTFGIYAIFLQKNGLNLLQVNLINFTFMISIFILEVPTGAFADAIGRKNSVLLGTLFLIAGLALYPIYRTFVGFIIAEILLAISSAFGSGAWDAWMVDTSKKQGYVGKVDYVFSQSNVISKIALIFGGFLGAYLAYVELGLPFYFGAFIGLIVLIFLLIFMESDQGKIEYSLKKNLIKMKNIAKDSISYSISHKVIFWLLLGGIVSTLIFQPMNMYWNIRFNNMTGGDKIWLMGWLWAFISIAMTIGAYSVRHFLKKGKDYSYLMILVSLGIFVPVIFSSLSHTIFLAFPAFLIYQLFRGVEKPVAQSFLNKYAEPEKRATILSFESMMSCLGAAGGLVLFGWIAKNHSIETSWIFAAIFSLFLIPIYLMARRKERHYA